MGENLKGIIIPLQDSSRNLKALACTSRVDRKWTSTAQKEWTPRPRALPADGIDLVGRPRRRAGTRAPPERVIEVDRSDGQISRSRKGEAERCWDSTPQQQQEAHHHGWGADGGQPGGTSIAVTSRGGGGTPAQVNQSVTREPVATRKQDPTHNLDPCLPISVQLIDLRVL